MSLPPGFLDELRTRLSLGQVVGRKVIWDSRKSNQGKGDLWASCPFHQEKSASFHVDDRKGYYYCFGCHAKGDAISFVRETENVGFMEAVEILAGEAGMPMPEQDPDAREKADRQTQLVDVMEHAVQYFRLQFKTGAALDARAYLDRRALSHEALERWEIGFAPDAWQGLWDVLKAKGIEDELILGAGLAKPSQKGGKPYDTFRGRIIFPIRDARGRCIAFGGRAMDPNDSAKYLNSPETELFDKGRSLYNLGAARSAVGKGQPMIVSEGYMDVIALCENGFTAAVAPLGTAITENQLQMLWRVADEPIIALDGDTAGVRAAMRLIDLALPLLEAGKSLRFALMPEGKDPDDLLRAYGAQALQKLLDRAIPMVDLLWQRETQNKNFDSPERKAGLDVALREKIKLIRDPAIRQYYGQAIKELRWQLFRSQNNSVQRSRNTWQNKQPQAATLATKSSVLATADDAQVTVQLRESVILAALICTPEVMVEFENGLESLQCQNSDHALIRDLILRYAMKGSEVLHVKIIEVLGPMAIDNMLSQGHLAIIPCIRSPGNIETARLTVMEELAKLNAAKELNAEIADAVQDLSGIADEGVTWRLSQATAAAADATRSGHEDSTQYETRENGAQVSRSERDAFDKLMAGITFPKSGR